LPATEVLVGNHKTLTDFLLPEWDSERPASPRELAVAAGEHGTRFVLVTGVMLTSKGMAGIPRASQVILAGVLVTYDLPLAGVAVIMGIDELMDMGRTTINLVGNCLSTAVMARWEGCFRTEAEPDDAPGA
jgi:proton glutamate symport protein